MRQRWQESAPPSLFRGSELLRLLAALMMLAVVAMLFFRFRDPKMWTVLAPNDTDSRATTNTAGPHAAKASSPQTASDGRPQATSAPTAEVPHPAETAADKSARPQMDLPPLDQDPDEAREAAMEFQAVTDGTLQLQPEEMVPYDRLVRWVQSQSFDELARRARHDILFTQLYQTADKYRGKLVALDLNVRQIVDAGENSNGVHLWEVRGWTAESQAWLYWLIVPELPPGMPVGPKVFERAKFVGFFFKLQGYYEAGAKPRASALQAPLLIGRLKWLPAPNPEATHDAVEWFWGLIILGAAGVIFIGGLLLRQLRPRRATRRPYATDRGLDDALPVEEWLDRVAAKDDANRDDCAGLRDKAQEERGDDSARPESG